MRSNAKAARIALFDFTSPAMRAFHMSWMAFFLCFFAWFGIARLMKIVRDELHLTAEQVGWCIVGSVAITVFARVAAGWLCDRFGPRRAYTVLLLFGSLPVMGIGLSHSFETPVQSCSACRCGAPTGSGLTRKPGVSWNSSGIEAISWHTPCADFAQLNGSCSFGPNWSSSRLISADRKASRSASSIRIGNLLVISRNVSDFLDSSVCGRRIERGIP
jgi:MFS family permease